MAIVKQSGSGRGMVFVDIKGKPQGYKDADGNDKHGSMVVSNKDKTKEVLPSNTAITGRVTDLDVRTNEYQGDTIHTLQVRIEDGPTEPPVQLSVTLGSFFAAKIVGLLNAADLSKPISFAVNTVREGDKMGDGVAERDNAFPTIRAGADNARLVPVYAGGADKLPEAPEVKMNGKTMKNMDPVNDVVRATIADLYAKLDAIKAGDVDGGPHDDDLGVSAADLAAAGEASRGNAPRG